MSHGVERVVRHLFWPICSSRTPGSTVCDDLIVTCRDLFSVSSVGKKNNCHQSQQLPSEPSNDKKLKGKEDANSLSAVGRV